MTKKGIWVLVSVVVVLALLLGVFGCKEAPVTPTTTSPTTSTPTTTQTPSEVITLKWHNSFPKAALNLAEQMWMDEVEEASNGRIKFDRIFGGALGTLDQAPENIRVRAFDLGQISAVYNPGAYPRTSVSVLPFLTTNTLAQYVSTNELFNSDLTNQDFATLNQKYLLNGMWAKLELMSKEPINNIADLGQWKLRTHGGAADAMTALGYTSYAIPWEEYAAAAERGVVDGGIQGTPADANDIGLGDVWKYWERFTWYYFPMTLVINLDAWNEIPADLQTLILAISETYNVESDNIYHEQELIADQALTAKGVQKVYWDSAEINKLKEQAGAPVWEKWVTDQTAAGISNAQEILDFYEARLQYYSE